MNDKLMFVIIFSGTFTLLGLIFIIIGIGIHINKKKKEISCTSMTYGKVTDLVRRQNYNGNEGYSSSWHPVFEYNVGERKFIKEYPYGSSQTKYAIGQNVEVYFNPENYHEYYIAGDTLPKTLSTIFTIVGIVAIFIAVISAILVL